MKWLVAFFFLVSADWGFGESNPEIRNFRVVFWNLKNFVVTAPPLQNSEARVKPAKEVESVYQTLLALKPDIFIGAEMGSRADLQILQRELANRGLSFTESVFVDGPDSERHLVALSRFPMKDQSVADLKFELDGRAERLQRGLLDISMETPTIRIVGLHLKSRRLVEGRDEQMISRWEAQLVREHLDSIIIADPGVPLLVVGDLNETKEQPAVRTIGGGPSDANQVRWINLADREGDSWTYFSKESDTFSRIDFAGISKQNPWKPKPGAFGLYREKSRHPGSDHRPIYLTFEKKP